VEQGETLINCLAYIDLNPVRAGLVAMPDEYRWCSMGYHVQSGNKDGFLSIDYGLERAEKLSLKERFARYREFVYENGGLKTGKGKSIDARLVDSERKKGYKLTPVDRLRHRTRYFTDSGIIGTKGYVQRFCKVFKESLGWKRERKPKHVAGLDGLYSLKRLSEGV
jgi:putative transposase